MLGDTCVEGWEVTYLPMSTRPKRPLLLGSNLGSLDSKLRMVITSSVGSAMVSVRVIYIVGVGISMGVEDEGSVRSVSSRALE